MLVAPRVIVIGDPAFHAQAASHRVQPEPQQMGLKTVRRMSRGRRSGSLMQ